MKSMEPGSSNNCELKVAHPYNPTILYSYNPHSARLRFKKIEGCALDFAALDFAVLDFARAPGSF